MPQSFPKPCLAEKVSLTDYSQLLGRKSHSDLNTCNCVPACSFTNAGLNVANSLSTDRFKGPTPTPIFFKLPGLNKKRNPDGPSPLIRMEFLPDFIRMDAPPHSFQTEVSDADIRLCFSSLSLASNPGIHRHGLLLGMVVDLLNGQRNPAHVMILLANQTSPKGRTGQVFSPFRLSMELQLHPAPRLRRGVRSNRSPRSWISGRSCTCH